MPFKMLFTLFLVALSVFLSACKMPRKNSIQLSIRQNELMDDVLSEVDNSQVRKLGLTSIILILPKSIKKLSVEDIQLIDVQGKVIAKTDTFFQEVRQVSFDPSADWLKNFEYDTTYFIHLKSAVTTSENQSYLPEDVEIHTEKEPIYFEWSSSVVSINRSYPNVIATIKNTSGDKVSKGEFIFEIVCDQVAVNVNKTIYFISKPGSFEAHQSKKISMTLNRQYDFQSNWTPGIPFRECRSNYLQHRTWRRGFLSRSPKTGNGD